MRHSLLLGALAICLGVPGVLTAAHQDALIAPVARASSSGPVEITAAAADSSGNSYLVGTRLLEKGFFPWLPGSERTVYAAKFDPAGNTVYSLTLGGKGNDFGLGIAADRNGNAFVVGYTTSPDFPLVDPVQTALTPGGTTGFVLKLGPDGRLVWSTYFGGAAGGWAGSRVNAVAVDAGGNAYITGMTDAPSLPTTPGALQTQNSRLANGFQSGDIAAGFAAKFDPDGRLLYSTYLGGSLPNCYGGGGCLSVSKFDSGTAIALDASGNLFIAGFTDTSNFPTTPGSAQPSCPVPVVVYTAVTVPFLVKMNSTGTDLVYGTYVCGKIADAEAFTTPVISALAVDSQGNAYVAGSAGNAGFPVTAGVLQTTLKGPTDAFVSKFDGSGRLVFSTFLGGSGAEAVAGIQIAPDNTILINGTTSSADFADGAGLFPGGAAFVARLDSQASRILNSLRLPTGVTDAAIVTTTGAAVLAAGSSGLVSRLVLDGVPAMAVLGAGNAATAGIQSAIVFGSAISIYGVGIGPASASDVTATGGRLPTSWNGVSVLIGRSAVPLLYVSPNQINAVASSYDLLNSTTIQILQDGNATASFSIATRASDPQIFRHPDESAVAVNQDGTFNSPSNPAHNATTVAVWGTGLNLCPDVDPGSIATAAHNTLGRILLTSSVSYSGCAPGAAGAVFQINFAVSGVSLLSSVPFRVYDQSEGPPNVTYRADTPIHGSQPFYIWVAP